MNFNTIKEYLENEISEIDNGAASFISETELKQRLNTII